MRHQEVLTIVVDGKEHHICPSDGRKVVIDRYGLHLIDEDGTETQFIAAQAPYVLTTKILVIPGIA